ncbi:DUF6809 family protein [Paenibacillus odorifer]|uniref:DUF6809 family protein n=1 Tax=Paenibacillus TaxID=44249 RepID=UPI00351BCB80
MSQRGFHLQGSQLPSEGDFDELESLLELYSQAQGMEMTAAFVCGFKTGAAMMIEILVDD